MKLKLLVPMLLAVCHSTMAFIPQSERQALIDFYNSTNGGNWASKWNLNEPVTKWYGVKVENGNVVAIRLMDNNLSGELPESLGHLTELKILDVAFNKIEGKIPQSISKLSLLEELRFGKNKLKGEIPARIVDLKHLKIIDFYDNGLTGKLPSGIEKLSSLEVLSISNNNISGDLPTGIGQLRRLKRLELAANNFEGDIPESIGNLGNLKSLILAENGFKGKFPTSILLLPNLKVVQLQNNDFDQLHLKNSLPTDSGFALLDYENEGEFSKRSFKDRRFSNTGSRTADSKFEDGEDDHN